jgi:hypothetical protein
VEEFERHICDVIGRESWDVISNKIHKLQLPLVMESETIENHYKELIWSDMSAYVKSLLQECNIEFTEYV